MYICTAQLFYVCTSVLLKFSTIIKIVQHVPKLHDCTVRTVQYCTVQYMSRVDRWSWGVMSHSVIVFRIPSATQRNHHRLLLPSAAIIDKDMDNEQKLKADGMAAAVRAAKDWKKEKQKAGGNSSDGRQFPPFRKLAAAANNEARDFSWNLSNMFTPREVRESQISDLCLKYGIRNTRPWDRTESEEEKMDRYNRVLLDAAAARKRAERDSETAEETNRRRDKDAFQKRKKRSDETDEQRQDRRDRRNEKRLSCPADQLKAESAASAKRYKQNKDSIKEKNQKRRNEDREKLKLAVSVSLGQSGGNVTAMKQEAKDLLEHLACLKLTRNSNQQINRRAQQQKDLRTVLYEYATTDKVVWKIMAEHTPVRDPCRTILYPFINNECFAATGKMEWYNALQDSAAMKKLPAEMQTLMVDKIKAFRASLRVRADPATKRIAITQKTLPKQHSWWEPYAQQFFNKFPELMDSELFE